MNTDKEMNRSLHELRSPPGMKKSGLASAGIAGVCMSFPLTPYPLPGKAFRGEGDGIAVREWRCGFVRLPRVRVVIRPEQLFSEKETEGTEVLRSHSVPGQDHIG